MSNWKTYIHLAIFCAGLLLHAFFPENVYIGIIGYLMIMLSPIRMYKDYEERIYEDPGQKVGKWVPFPNDKLNELLGYVEEKSSVSTGSSKAHKTIVLSYFAVWFVTFFVAGFGYGLFEGSVPLIVLIDLPMVCYVFYLFYGGDGAPHPLCIQKTALTCFNTMELPAGFSKRFEARIVNDENGDPDILEARLQIRPDKPMNGFLCMMATISRTNVQGNIYPYAYYVMVFKGPQMARVSTRFSSELTSLIGNSIFRTEASIQDGDSVIVILPRVASKYTTDLSDCMALSSLMVNTCMLMDQYRSEIEMVCNVKY